MSRLSISLVVVFLLVVVGGGAFVVRGSGDETLSSAAQVRDAEVVARDAEWRQQRAKAEFLRQYRELRQQARAQHEFDVQHARLREQATTRPAQLG